MLKDYYTEELLQTTKAKGQSQVHVIYKKVGTETGDTDYRNYSFPTYMNVKCGALGNENIQCLCKVNYSGEQVTTLMFLRKPYIRFIEMKFNMKKVPNNLKCI